MACASLALGTMIMLFPRFRMVVLRQPMSVTYPSSPVFSLM